MDTQSHDFTAAGHRLAATTWGQLDATRPTIVMLHGGLDCTSTWKDLPEAIASATGLAVIAYDRFGYGRSEQLAGARVEAYRREESGPVLDDLFQHFGIRKAVLFGHSDGGAMAVLGAATHPNTVQAVYTCAATIAMEPETARGMADARDAFENQGLRERLLRHHGDNTDSMFWSWYGAWASADTPLWLTPAQVGAVKCSVTALFGRDDEYGWRASAHALLDQGTMTLELIALPGVGHHPQQLARGVVLESLRGLIGRLPA